MRKIIDGCYKKATQIINDNRDLLELLATTLLEYETLTKEQIDYLVENGKMTSEEEETTYEKMSLTKLKEIAKEKNIVKTISTLIASTFIYFFMPLLLPLAIFLLFLLIISIYLLGSISFMLSPIQYMKKRSKLLLSFFLFKPSSFWEKSF